jgi:hypothetical protein
MAENKAWLTGVDPVVKWYEDMAPPDAPYYSVWGGRQLIFSYSGLDLQGGVDILVLNLNMAVESKNSSVLTLRLHQELSKGMYVNDRTPYHSSLCFRAVPVGDDALAIYNLSGAGMLGQINERLKKLEGGFSDDKPQGAMGFITGLLENPQVGPLVAQAAIGAIMGLVNKFVPGIMPGAPGAAPPPSPPMPAIGSIQDGVHDFDWAMETMERVDPDMEKHIIKLAELSEKNPDFFKMLISQLKAM